MLLLLDLIDDKLLESLRFVWGSKLSVTDFLKGILAPLPIFFVFLVGMAHLDVSGHVTLDRAKSCRAKHLEESNQTLSGLQELGGSYSIVLAGIDGHIDEALLEGVEKGAISGDLRGCHDEG